MRATASAKRKSPTSTPSSSLVNAALVQKLQAVARPSFLRAVRQELFRREHEWKPFPDKADGTIHPQRMALESEADILGYGGAAGGGKSDLLLGAAGKQHHRSIIFRRVFPSLRGIIDRSREIYNPEGASASNDSYNESMYRWRLPSRNGAQVQFGSLQYDKDVLAHQGQARDFHGFDELTEFTEYQFRYIIGWNRSARKGQRCRVIATMNPPTTVEGEWVIRFFAPWLDPLYAGKRAVSGELRWFTTVEGKDTERKGPDDYVLDDKNGDKIYPKSRTFIFSRVQDNPVLMASGYMTTLQSLPEPLRSKLLYGDFMSMAEEDPWVMFPRDWVLAAQKRWREQKEPAGEVDQLGIDVARGGTDHTVYTPRKGHYFCKQVEVPGRKTPDGASVIAIAAPLCTAHTQLGIDVVAVGSSPYDLGKMNKMKIMALNGAEKAPESQKAKAGGLRFYNKRALWHWKLREDLDPKSGMDLALPDTPEVTSQLCAIKWELTIRGIKARDKDETKDILGRSPDNAESIIYAHAQDYSGGSAFVAHARSAAAAEKAASNGAQPAAPAGTPVEEDKTPEVALATRRGAAAFAEAQRRERLAQEERERNPVKTVAEVAAAAPKRQVKRSSNFAEATGQL